MSTSHTATVFYGYSLPRSELTRRAPNPLWGKSKFDPDTGEKVTQFVTEEVDLGLEEGEGLLAMTKFRRFDAGYDDDDCILLGIQLAEADLDYGPPEPQEIVPLNPELREQVKAEVEKLLHKAEIDFDSKRMGYWLAGYVG